MRASYVSFATTPEIRRRMQSQRRLGTEPEMALRKELYRRGFRYRVERRPIPSLRRRVDMVFISARVAVEVRGCFWHYCPRHGMLPSSNTAWWKGKLLRNRERDRETARALRSAGWRLVVVWEHEDPVRAADRVEKAIRREVSGGIRSTRIETQK